MKKRIGIITVMIAILILGIGCSDQDKPEDTVSEFIDAMKSLDLELMASKVNPEDREDVEDISIMGDEVEDAFEEKFLEYIESNAKKITYEINDSKIDGDKATVNLDFKYVDGGPLFKATFQEYMKEIFGLAFTNLGEDISDEENAQVFIASMDKQMEEMEETFTEKTLDIKCIKLEDGWYIDDPSDELLDVAMSNMISTIEGMDDLFDFDEEEEEFSLAESLNDEDINLIEKGLGDEIELKTINFKITDIEETELLAPEYGSEVEAKEGAKFLLVSMEVTNTTKSEFTFPDAFILIDNEDREFTTYSDSYFAIDDYLDQRDLPPSIKEKGRLVYELPKDSSSYYIVMAKADTDDVYKVILK